jgi:putative hemolysin
VHPGDAVVTQAKNDTDIGLLRERRRFGDGYHIVDELLYERTDTLRKFPLLWKVITSWCLPLFKYQAAVEWADRLGPRDGFEGRTLFADYLDLDVRVTGLEHVPRSGRLLIAANHPTGIVDALAVYAAVDAIRPDARYFSNRDIVRIAPKMRDFVIPLEWLRRRRTTSALRETLEASVKAFREDRAVVIFPGGGIARGSLSGLKELEWLTATAKLMRRYQCPVLPIHIRARNSWLYYTLEAIHHEIRDLSRFREVMGKRRQRFDLTIGPAIQPDEVGGTLSEATAALQTYVEHDLGNGRPRRF